jgi:hypothetical protein
MTRSSSSAMLVGATLVGLLRSAPVWAQSTSGFTGRWTLSRELSQFPREVGFGVDWLSPGAAGRDSRESGGGGQSGSGGGGTDPFTARRESEDDARRLRQLTAEVRNPSTHLTIIETSTALTITDDRGLARTFRLDGRDQVLEIDGVPVGVTAKREAGRLVVLYGVEQGRELRYTYSRVANPPQLAVDIQFLERGRGDGVRRIYEPTSANETPVAPAAASSPATLKPSAALPAASAPDSGRPVAPASADHPPAQTFNPTPDAEFKGLTKLGIVVEDLSSQATACGLTQSALETTVSKHLSDAGFRVIRNSDEDTYLYVNVITTSLSTGLCVSRYDVFLYTHTTAKLSYQDAPVLVQVSLLHKGGLAGGASAAHADGVLRGVQEYVDQFSTRIRNANK